MELGLGEGALVVGKQTEGVTLVLLHCVGVGVAPEGEVVLAVHDVLLEQLFEGSFLFVGLQQS